MHEKLGYMNWVYVEFVMQRCRNSWLSRARAHEEKAAPVGVKNLNISRSSEVTAYYNESSLDRLEFRQKQETGDKNVSSN